MSCTFTVALSAVSAQCPIWLFFVVPWFCVFPVCCLGIFWMILKWFQLLLLLLVSLVFMFHICCISVVRSLYFRIFSASFLITFLSPEIAASINMHVTFSSSYIMMSSLLLRMVLSVSTCWLHNIKTLPSGLVSANFGTCTYPCSLSIFTPVSMHMVQCSWAHTQSCLFICCSFARWHVLSCLIKLLT